MYVEITQKKKEKKSQNWRKKKKKIPNGVVSVIESY